MGSPQSIISPYKESSFIPEPEKKIEFSRKSRGLSSGISVQRLDGTANFIGVLDVYVHQARDIHNICIYHKQDVYAKLCLTSDPENALATKIINGGGQSPVFNDVLRLNVHTLECSLKCEIWMMSRVRNYMEDQLLGFALVPLSEVFIDNGKLDQEFPLSSTDLFHSPAGFVKLSFSYSGEWPEVIPIPVPPTSRMADKALQDTHPESLPNMLEKIEFPDPKVVSENDLMVSEYFSIQSNNLESHGSDSFSADAKNQCNSELDDNAGETFPTWTVDSHHHEKHDSPSSNLSTNESPPFASLPAASSHSCATPGGSKFLNEESIQPTEEYTTVEKKSDVYEDTGCNASENLHPDTFPKPVVTVNIESEVQVVQQDIVDMYMKSMQQFTESLAKMKLPLDSEGGPTTSSGNSSSEKLETPKSSGSRVFYGSGAFF
ncbi:hypothetical protein DM860_011488 [Cuscuta australis]|uniref:C2 domain-containing protein n=1 Tax=Cuscuta australis TaxID=267555 RepID=A0A328CZU9_9ASTE|nr:hypothetical protein DM860_011488 [Cuscuta australis]